MPQIKLTNYALQQSLAEDAVVYHFNKNPTFSLSSFDDGLNEQLWRNHFKPFACAITQHHSQDIILVRDHLGLEPLYYCHHLGKTLVVGQSIPEILKQLPNTPALLEDQIELLFSNRKYYSDETLYQGIYRVEPGHLMHFKADGTVIKTAFWQLNPQNAMLHYDDERDYLEHFSMLMKEAMLNATEDHNNVAAEFSAGLDSSAVYCAAVNINVRPKLYMHVAPPGAKSAEVYNDAYEKAFIAFYQLADIMRIGADNFDPIQVLSEYAQWFAGPAAYLFPMFANPIHRAVVAGQHPILLSGFGGDQCVSGQLSLNFFLPELIHQKNYQQAWHELKAVPLFKKALIYAKHMHPGLYAQALNLKVMKRHFVNAFRPRHSYQSTQLHPYERMHYSSVSKAEYALLQGPDCHEVRMRIEDSSIVSKQLGFEYRYPLLYPKLLEFMLTVPTVQKRRDGRGRYLIRQYLSQFLPDDLFGTYRKQEGLGIVPSTFERYKKSHEQGRYHDAFKDLPYSQFIKNNDPSIQLRHDIKGFMIKSAAGEHPDRRR